MSPIFSNKTRYYLKKAPFFLAVAAVVCVIAFFSWLNHDHFERAMVRQAQTQLTIIARSEAQSIEKYIGDIHDELDDLASDPRLFKEPLNGIYRNTGKLTDLVYLTDGKGVVVDVAPLNSSLIGSDLSKEPDVAAMLAGRKPFTSGVFEGRSGAKEISNLHPVFDGGRFTGIIRTVLYVDRINKLIEHINSEQGVLAVVIDDESNIISSANKDNIGRNAEGLLGENPSRPELLKMKEIVGQMHSGRSGSSVIRYGSGSQMLVSYTPIKIGGETWSVAVAMDYDSIIGPINRNARDNLVFFVFILAVFLAAGMIFYRSEEKNAELSISATCLDLINKQLHLEIEKRREIEKNLNECLRNRKEQ